MKKPFSAKSKAGIPARYQHFEKSYPAVMEAVEALGEATQSAGPLDSKSRALVKLAIAIGGVRGGGLGCHNFCALGVGRSPGWVRDAGGLAVSESCVSTTYAGMSEREDFV